ncbi:MAG: hypothetical protein E7E86_09650, partial [Staphylococcus sp.]|nr:hypothetical protein [Staphylococcus sp.]
MIKFLTITGLMLVLSAGSALANGFGINVTRVIFKGNSDSSTVVLRNASPKDTYIVQPRVRKTVDGFDP